MNWTLIKALIVKDWTFNKAPLLLYTFIGLLSVVLLTIENKAVFYVANVLIITAVIIVGAHLIFVTVVNERKEQMLPFVMSLPVSYKEYTMAKMLFNLGAYLLIWILLTAVTLIVIFSKEVIPNGLIPFVIIALLELAVAYILVLAVAIISESETWTIVVMTLTNICVSLFWFFLASIESINQFMTLEMPVWNSTAISFIAIELLICMALISLTFYFQSKKTEFL